MDDDLLGIGYLKAKLARKKSRVRMRYNYYEMKYRVKDFEISTPKNLVHISNPLGWCAKAVDTLSDRLIFSNLENDTFNMSSIFNLNNPSTFFDSAILSSLISSCCFVYVSTDDDGFPRLQVIDGANATGIIDPITGFLKEGYAILDVDKNGNPSLEAYFTSDYTEIITNGNQSDKIDNPTLYPLLVPIINKPDAVRPFGHSRISRTCMATVQSACRTVKRSEISAEFYSFPQKYATGLAQDVEIEKWKASISSMMSFSKDEDGDSPTLGQFTQQSMAPHYDHLKMFAAIFAGETGLTLDDLGFVTDNPSSSEAIKAAHENLRLMARKAQRDFATGFLNVGFLAACLRDEQSYQRNKLFETKVVWEPIFEPDAAMLSNIGDGIIKVNQAVEGYFNKDNIKKLTGIESDS